MHSLRYFGESKGRNEIAEWHVAWVAERHNYTERNICRITQRWIKLKSRLSFGANKFPKVAAFSILRAQLRYRKATKDSLISTLRAEVSLLHGLQRLRSRSPGFDLCTPQEKGVKKISPGAYQETNQLRASDKPWRTTSLTLKVMQERNVCSQGTLFLTVNYSIKLAPKKAQQRSAHALQLKLFPWVILPVSYIPYNYAILRRFKVCLALELLMAKPSLNVLSH